MAEAEPQSREGVDLRQRTRGSAEAAGRIGPVVRLRIVHGSARVTTPVLETVLDPETAGGTVMYGRAVKGWRRALTGWARGSRVAKEELERGGTEASGGEHATDGERMRRTRRGRTRGEPADGGGGDTAGAPAETPHTSRSAMRKGKRVRSRGVDGRDKA